MKEHKITIEINPDGSLSAEADGFTGDACLKDLERLLEELSFETATIERKPEDRNAQRRTIKTQTIGKKP